jgi:NADPH-ferrihemoprotein reductase
MHGLAYASSIQSFPAGKLSIYYGSQTGTAEGFARQLAEEGRKHKFDCKTVDLEDWELPELQEDTMAIFLMATYGEGEPTDNAVEFYREIGNSESELSEDALGELKYTVFGLGNRQYEVGYFAVYPALYELILPCFCLAL